MLYERKYISHLDLVLALVKDPSSATRTALTRMISASPALFTTAYAWLRRPSKATEPAKAASGRLTVKKIWNEATEPLVEAAESSLKSSISRSCASPGAEAPEAKPQGSGCSRRQSVLSQLHQHMFRESQLFSLQYSPGHPDMHFPHITASHVHSRVGIRDVACVGTRVGFMVGDGVG